MMKISVNLAVWSLGLGVATASSLAPAGCAPSPEANSASRDADRGSAAAKGSAEPSKRGATSKRGGAATAIHDGAEPGSEAPPAPSAAEPPEETPPVRLPTTWASETTNGMKRIEEARAAKLDVVKGLFQAAKVDFPPGQLLLRGFKKERRIEIWAASGGVGPLSHVTTYEICYASGVLGPKRREGDLQVPEGFYTVNLYNPASTYYLAMQVSYPNLSDRILGDKSRPGSEIMIHGNCVSIGCMAMSDERAQEIWLTAAAVRDRRGTVHVHLFPTRDMAGLLSTTDRKEHVAFWENIKEGLDYFQEKRVIPSITIDKAGRYHFSDPQ